MMQVMFYNPYNAKISNRLCIHVLDKDGESKVLSLHQFTRDGTALPLRSMSCKDRRVTSSTSSIRRFSRWKVMPLQQDGTTYLLQLGGHEASSSELDVPN